MVATRPFSEDFHQDPTQQDPDQTSKKRSRRHHQKAFLSPEQKKRIAHYFELCKTGKYDYPPLVDLAHATYQVSQAKPGELLLPRKIAALCRQADQAVEQLAQHSFNFSQTLDQLGERLSNHKPSPSQIRLITQNLTTDLAPPPSRRQHPHRPHRKTRPRCCYLVPAVALL